MSDNRDVAAKLMGEAATLVLRQRGPQHGSAENSFEMIGDLWTVYLRHARQHRQHDRILAEDVAQLMSIHKKCRAVYGDTTNAENFVDDIGYVALAGMLQLPDPAAKDRNTETEKAENEVANEIAAELDKKERVHAEIMTGLGKQARKVPRQSGDGFAGVVPPNEEKIDA